MLPTDFHEQHSVRSKSRRRAIDHSTNTVETVHTSTQCRRWLILTHIFVEFRVLRISHIRRIRNDQIKLLVACINRKRLIQIANMKLNRRTKAFCISARECNGLRNNVGRHHTNRCGQRGHARRMRARRRLQRRIPFPMLPTR